MKKLLLLPMALVIIVVLGCSDTSPMGQDPGIKAPTPPGSAATTPDRGGESGWLVDFAKAKAQSAKEGKPILMEFTGSDWCPPCIALHDNVLTSDVFKEQMPKKFILLKLDNPNDKSKQTPAEIAQYKKLSAEYKVEGVPTIIVADATGKEQHRQVGYSRSQTAQEWVTELIAAGGP